MEKTKHNNLSFFSSHNISSSYRFDWSVSIRNEKIVLPITQQVFAFSNETWEEMHLEKDFLGFSFLAAAQKDFQKKLQ